MLRQAVATVARRAAVRPAAPGFARAFAGVPTKMTETAVRPFEGASPSEPEMPYIEEPSMLYVSCLVATPYIISCWFLVKFV
mmetsp:Transcript_93070/g.203737  ORF Transcript_93070/g.203737 Transcript_93070/m.203737 type:complete len:82 (-) Transcript_93070:163-408(-)